MSRNVNRITNPDFSLGRSSPNGWTWEQAGEDVRWERLISERGSRSSMCIAVGSSDGSGFWAQTLVCKPGDYYRVEATISSEIEAQEIGCGAVLAIEPLERAGGSTRNDPPPEADLAALVTPPLHRAVEPINLRAYFHAPPGVRRARVSVGIHRGQGRLVINEVRFIRILEPDEQSHILALPLPDHALPPPCRAESVAVCSDETADRPLAAILRAAIGATNVLTLSRDDATAKVASRTDAILLPDAAPPRGLRSLRALVALAEKRIVVISLSAFTKLAGSAIAMRRVEQPDDPIHAKVAYANHATRGFALHDVFAFAALGKFKDGYAQNQFKKSPGFKAFCKRHGFVTQLESMCDKDSTSHQPICLYRESSGGGLYVLDLDPIEAPATSSNAPNLAVHLLLSILGRTRRGLGQYVAPVETERKIRESVREMGARIDTWVVHEEDVPAEKVTHQLVTIGRDDQSFGLPLRTKPLILVRSGLVSGDVESVYGAFLWFKQLVRMTPHVCPYAEDLGRLFRLAWVPLAAPWAQRDGWQRPGDASANFPGLEVDSGDGALAALIDLVSMPVNRVRVVMPTDSGGYTDLAHWLPRVSIAFGPEPRFHRSVDAGAGFTCADDLRWRHLTAPIEVAVEPQMLDRTPLSGSLGNALVLRIETPGCDHDFTANSIHRTDLAATALEQVIGAVYGLIAVNRSTAAITLDGFPPVAVGEALIVPRDDNALRTYSRHAG